MLNSQIKDFTSTPNILYVTQVPNCGIGGNQGQNLVKVVNLIPLGGTTTPGTTTATNQQIVNSRPTISVLNKPTTTTTTITPRIVQLPNNETRPVIKLTRVAPKIINLSRAPASAPVNASHAPSPQVQTLIPINFPVNNINNINNTAINIIPEQQQQQQQPVINHLVPQCQLQPNHQISTTNSIDSLTFFDDDLPIDIHPKQFFEHNIVKDIERPEQKPTKEKPQTIHQLILQQQQQHQQQIRPQKATITTLLSKQTLQKPQIPQPQQQTQPKQQPIQQPPPQQVVKRPVNAFILWSQQERRKLNAGLTSASSERLGDISKQLGLKWGLMSQEEKLPYIIEAERHRQAHRMQYPDYRPQKSSTNTNGHRSKRSRRSVESSSVGTSSSNTTFSDCYSQPQASPYSTTSSSELANSTADIDDLDISNFDFDSADFETLISSFDVNQPESTNQASATDFNSGSGSGSINPPPIMIDLTCEELVENRYLNSDTTLKHYMPNCSSLALTPPDDDLNVDFGRKKAQIRKTQSTNATRRIYGFLTSIKLTPLTGEKKLKPGHNQTTRVIQIRGDNAELKQITEMLLNRGPIRPGENLLNSIDAATLSALMAHVNRLGPATSIQSNYDDLDIGYDWEIDRSKLESASTIEPSISTLKNEPSYAQIPNLTCLSAQLTDPTQSTYNYSSFDYAPPSLCSSNSGGEQAELNTNDLLFSDDDFKTLINSPIMFDNMPIMF